MTHRTDFMAEGAMVVQSLDQALTDPVIWVVGGEQIYTLAMSRATRCAVTEIDIDLPRDDGDVLAPVLDESWVGTTEEWQTSRSELRYRLHSYCRR